MKISKELLAKIIAAEIVRQAGDDCTDNLGDGESLIFMCNSPVVNVVELAEAIILFIDNDLPIEEVFEIVKKRIT